MPKKSLTSGGSRISQRRGRQSQGGGAKLLFDQKFCKICMKMKEFGPRGGGARPWRPPLDPPMLTIPISKNILLLQIHTTQESLLSMKNFAEYLYHFCVLILENVTINIRSNFISLV